MPARSSDERAAPTLPGLRFVIEGLVYALDREPRKNGRRSVVTVTRDGDSTAPPLVDRVDVFAFRSRKAFAGLVADLYGKTEAEVLGHLAVVLDECERAHAAPEAAYVQPLTPARRRAAEALLKRRDLLDRAAAAMEACGYVGEPQVKRLAYLVATSRLLARPLNALLLAPPGSGKSAVLEAVAALVPEEHVVPLARLTAHSLYYMGEDALRHRLVLVDEWEGQADADHALRVLQSRGELRLSVTVKGKAESFLVRGPVSVMSGSSSSDLDLQNTSRCLELVLDDSPEQTRRVQDAQARAWAGVAREPALEPWRDAQRLLAEGSLPVPVVIPFAPRLTFPARTTADRRASAKLLGLIATHAVLHGYQRERDGEERVVASLDDYEAVYALVAVALGTGTAGLSPRAARAYRWLLDRGGPADRREIAGACGWAYNTAKKALAELEAEELVHVTETGPPARYATLGGSILGSSVALTAPEALRAPGARRVARARR